MSSGKWPTARDYVDWVSAHDCTVAVEPFVRGNQLFQRLDFRSAAGATVTELVGDMSDPLMSTTIARLDRRLGLKSNLFV